MIANAHVQMLFVICISAAVCSTQHIARKSTLAPFSSCSKHERLPTVFKCYRHCLRNHDVIYLIGHDPEMERCYCCPSTPRRNDSFITGKELQTYITGGCNIIASSGISSFYERSNKQPIRSLSVFQVTAQ
jgi:hypothetical protein